MHGHLLHPDIELGSHTLLLEAVKNGLGKACVIKEFSTQELKNHEIYEIQLDQPLIKRSIGYAWLSRKTLTPAAIQFIELLK